MNLNIRNFPDELAVRLKKRAAERGEDFHLHILGTLNSSLVLKRDGTVDEEMVVTCPACGLSGPLVRFGDNARCFHCGIGFLVPEGA